jgi:DNA-directed RNA polymerase omega subunit
MAHETKVVPIEKLLERIPNRYEAIIVAAREAQRLNPIYRSKGESPPKKITTIALERVIEGKVQFNYFKRESRRIQLTTSSDHVVKIRENPAHASDHIADDKS